MLIKMAIKNIFRNKKRTIITVLSVFFGIMLLIVFNGFNIGLEWQIRDLYIKTYCSDFQVMAEGYDQDEMMNPIDYPLNTYKSIEKELSNDKRVNAYSSRITFQGAINNGKDEIRVTGIGIDPSKEDKVFSRSEGIIDGSYIKSGENGVVIGNDLADLLDLKVGDKVNVVGQTKKIGSNTRQMVVKGLIRTGNPLIDEGDFFIPIDVAQDLLEFNSITDIVVSLNNHSQLDNVMGQFDKQKYNNKVTVLSWRDLAANYVSVVELRKRMMNIVSIFILIIAAVGIINTMLMAMVERKREIGNLMALGLRRIEIMKLFIFEGGVIGLIGSIFAAIVGSLICYIGQKKGLPLDTSTLGDTPIAGRLYFYFNFADVFRYFILGVIIASVATFYPARKISKLEPIEALTGNRG